MKHASLIIDAPKKQFVFVPHNGQEITVSNSEAGSVSFIPSESGDTLGVLKAVIRKVSAAYQKGIRTGDYLIEVNGENWVSIHAPHAGSDQYNIANQYGETEFQSTPPMRGATLSMA